jgi:hypothetical protein
MTVQLAARYEGTEPFPDTGGPPRTVAGAVRVAVTLAIVVVPFAGLGVATPGQRSAAAAGVPVDCKQCSR